MFGLMLIWLSRFSPAGASPSFENLLRVYSTIEGQIPPSPFQASLLPVVKKDSISRVWAAWEEWGNDQSQVRISRVQEGRMVSPQTVSRQKGFNISPDFFFDQTHSPWVIWINYFNEEYRIYVQEISSRRTWLLTSSFSSTITSPKIIFDRDNTAWVFWNETKEKHGDIFYRVFDHRNWSPRKIVPQENTFPALNPDAAADSQGLLWLTWSRYDGEDYEIYLSGWNGRGWLKERRITDNSENDVFPSIGLGPNDFLVIGWTQSSWLGNQICMEYLDNSKLSQEIKISAPATQFAASKIIQDGEKTGIVWKSADGIKIKEFSPGPSAEADLSRSAQPGPHTSPRLVFNPSFDENKYIGLGDSITYGYMDRLPAPELGYIPRLDAVLNQNFGPSQVINEGIGGETTVGGLSRIDRVISTNAARYMLIMEGTNDAISSSLSMDTSAFNLSEMIRKCLEAGVFPVIATIIPRRDWLWDYEFVRVKHLDLVEKIRRLAPAFPVPLVDQYDIFYNYPSSDGGLLALLSSDKLHPSEKGYQVMAEAWFDEIRNFPFPPVNVQLIGTGLAGDFLFDLRNSPPLRPPKKPRLSSSQASGNLLIWKDNPKIFDQTKIEGYKVYRMNRGSPEARFRFLAVIREPLRFLDQGARVFDEYIYVISTLRDDGVEGPCSRPIEE